MFRKKVVEKISQETENSEHCFIELKKHEVSRELVGNMLDEYCYIYDGNVNFIRNPFHQTFDRCAFYEMLTSPNRKDHFSFHKELDAKPDSGNLGLGFAVRNKFEIRLSIKINMSLDQLNTLLDSTYFNYHGVITSIPRREEEVWKILQHSLMNSYIDIKDKNTHEWYRIEIREFNKKHTHICQIL